MATAEGDVSRNALVFMANDRYFDWALTFLESVREKNASLPLYWIPYDGAVAKIATLAGAFDFERIDDGITVLDAFADRLFPSQPMKRANLRKYVGLGLDCDEIAYFDIDAAVLVDPARFFGHVKPGTVDLVYFSTSPGFVYRSDRMDAARRHFPKMRQLSAGAFVTSRRALTIAEIIATVEANMELYQSLRRRGALYDQPLLNFVLDQAGKACRHISEVDGTLGGMVSFRNPEIALYDGRIVERWNGKEVPAIHWAGAVKIGLELLSPRLWPLRRLRAGFLRRGRERLRAAPPRAR